MNAARPSVSDKRNTFRQLHESGCFVIPNPWDIGSAVFLQSLGFKALASTSSGLAWSRGQADNTLARDTVLEHLSALVAATDVPVNADFENGFAREPAGVAESVRLAMQSGVAGLSIEDSTGDAARPLYDDALAVSRLRAARESIDRAGGDALLVARCECFLVGRPDIDLATARLRAYANAGADCLYAPGVRTPEHIQALVRAVAPRPFNLLVHQPIDMSVADIAALGVRRISVGGALARCAWGGFVKAAEQLASGSFEGLALGRFDRSLDGLFRPRSPPR
ncbi:MAG: isocitrate lyase/phosphoenolpyruvate mutase family protein [Steroidobacteraceae bacterium]